MLPARSNPTDRNRTFFNPPSPFGIQANGPMLEYFSDVSYNEVEGGAKRTQTATSTYRSSTANVPKSKAVLRRRNDECSDEALWFTEIGMIKIGRITASGTLSEFNATHRADVRHAKYKEQSARHRDRRGTPWFTEKTSGKVTRIRPAAP